MEQQIWMIQSWNVDLEIYETIGLANSERQAKDMMETYKENRHKFDVRIQEVSTGIIW